MNQQDREKFIDYMTNPEKNGGATALLTTKEADWLFLSVCSMYAHFEPEAWKIGQIFDCDEDYVDFWVSRHSSEVLFNKYIKYIKGDPHALGQLSSWLVCQEDQKGYDSHRLPTGRVVRFYNSL